MCDAFIAELVAQAESDERVVLLVGDLGWSVVEPFADRFPDRFINAGVAEQNMIGLAAGLASEGCRVFIYSIANFPTFRCAEQLRNDVDHHVLPVTIVAVGGGLAYGNPSMGGAVRYVFNKPDKQFGFSALGSVSSTSSGGTHSQNVMLNVPLGATTAARMVLFNRHETGVVDNSTLGLKNTNDLAQTGGRVLLSANPTPQLSITAMLLSQTTEVDDSSIVTDIGTLSKNVGALSPRKSKFDLGSLQVGYDFGGLRLT